MRSLRTINDLVHAFRGEFSAPTFANFTALLLAWITTPFKHTITGLIRPLLMRGTVGGKHFSVFHRFFSRACWELDDLGRGLVQLLDDVIPKDVTLIVDDTLCRRSGSRILGAGMFHDPLTSSSGGASGRRVCFAFGLNFVVLSLWIPAIFCHSGGIAVPVLFRLYRSKKTCPEAHYRKRTDLAVELLGVAASWLKGRTLTVVGDAEYACRTVLSGLLDGMEMTGPLPADAQLHAPDIIQGKLGRKRTWGKRLPSPRELATDDSLPWRKLTAWVYGSEVTYLVKEATVVWKSAGAGRVLKLVVTRDPKGRLADRYLFSTHCQADAQEVLETYARRWEQELCFRNVKQHLGLEEIANGFTRRKKRSAKKAGPQADNRKQPIASARTGPFAFIAHGLVVAWYLKHGQPKTDVRQAHKLAPWYRHKTSVSFADMLTAFRRQCLIEQFPRIQIKCGFAKIPVEAIPEWLTAA